MENPGIQEETLHLCRIAGTGSYVPERVVTNADFEKIVDTSDAWIVERTGIRERRFAAENEFFKFLQHFVLLPAHGANKIMIVTAA